MKPDESRYSRPGWQLVRVPEKEPTFASIETRGDDGVPYFLGYRERLAQVHDAICQHRDEYVFVRTIGAKAPPCVARASRGRDRSDAGCPSGIERECGLTAMRMLGGHGIPRLDQIIAGADGKANPSRETEVPEHRNLTRQTEQPESGEES